MDIAIMFATQPRTGPSPFRKEFLREQMCRIGLAGLPPLRRVFVGV